MSITSQDLGIPILRTVFWLLVVPVAVSRLSLTLAQERITEHLRAYVEARWPESFTAYLIACPVCLSHWLAAMAAIVFTPVWDELSGIIPIWGGSVTIGVMMWLAATGIATKYIYDYGN